MNAHDPDSCVLCGGCGEIESTYIDDTRATVGCPFCIAYENQLHALQAQDDLHKVRTWINTLPEPRPEGTAHISMVLAQAMQKLGMLD